MKRFFKYITINILVPVILYFSIFLYPKVKISEALLNDVHHNEIEEYGWLGKFDSLYGVILGSSTLRYGVSCGQIKREYETWVNLSMDARDPIVDYLLLKRWCTLYKPKNVLVGLDPWIFTKGYYNQTCALMYCDLDFKEKLLYCFHIDKSLPLKMYNNIFRLISFKFNKDKFANDENKIYKVPADNGSVALYNKPLNFNLGNSMGLGSKQYGWSDLEFDYIKKIVLFCKESKIKLIFVIPPKRKDYIDHFKKVSLKEHQEWWSLLDKVANGEFVVGHYSDMINYNQDSVFEESYHLSENGQSIYSKILRNEIDSPRVITNKLDLF